ncbi:MAG: hypothetical protein K8W52_33385 [Deltaproteobacteria bacterium]|nr:hypothetical protein [Deltaproteobacteria bacterium]
MRASYLSFLALALVPTLGCVEAMDDSDDFGETEAEIASAGAWYHLDATSGLGAATVSVVNGYKVKCPSGATAKTCQVSALVVPADCNWECQDGLLGMQGEAVVKGHFDHGALVIEAGLDTWRTGLGSYSVYRVTAAATCAADPCPHALQAQKLNIASAPVAITKVDFTRADDVNYQLDPTRGDDQASSAAGLLVSGRIVSHVFKADRVWRLETPKPLCEPQLVARAHAYLGDATDIVQYRTVYEAERATDPNGGSVAWLVRTGENPTTVTFTSGLNDLWVERFDIDKTTCAITTTAEH